MTRQTPVRRRDSDAEAFKFALAGLIDETQVKQKRQKGCLNNFTFCTRRLKHYGPESRASVARCDALSRRRSRQRQP